MTEWNTLQEEEAKQGTLRMQILPRLSVSSVPDTTRDNSREQGQPRMPSTMAGYNLQSEGQRD